MSMTMRLTATLVSGVLCALVPLSTAISAQPAQTPGWSAAATGPFAGSLAGSLAAQAPSGLHVAGLHVVSVADAAATSADPADPADPKFWLQRMVDASHTVSFTGDIVYGQGTELNAHRIVRVQQDDTPHERLHSLNGPVREILREDRKVTRILGDARLVVVDQGDPRHRLTDLTPQQIRQLESWYRMTVVGPDRIAQRPAAKLHLLPKDNSRYGYMLWIDRETGLLLRSQMRDQADIILEQFMYISIDYNSLPDDAMEPEIEHHDFHHHTMGPAAEQEGHGIWDATDLPPGFRLLDEGWRHTTNGTEPVRHLLFGDGLASVSVYISDDEGKPFHGRSQQGSMSVAGKIKEGYQLTVVGDVPSQTVMRVLNGLEHRP
jgi:sigma-E factor negative regulatory protein RseB